MPDEHPAQEEQHDLRDSLVRDERGHERRESGDEGDHEELLQTSEDVHVAAR